MTPAIRKMTEAGVEWHYRPGSSYTAKYRGWTITIHRCTGFKLPWRLAVRANGGGSLSFNRQFYDTVKTARQTGIKLIEEYFQKKS